MFNATYFTYDGVFSGIYGLKIADFNNNSVVETSVLSPSLNVEKPNNINRFFYNGIKYEDVPQHEFSVLSEVPIDDISRREILSWLSARDGFKLLEVHQQDLEKYKFHCIFTDIRILFVNGECHGFKMTANFDSPYQYGDPTEVTLVGDGTEKILNIINESDIKDNYVYPTVWFKSIANQDKENIVITNMTDDTERHFKFSLLYDNEEITVDNELRYISSDRGGPKLDNFNKNWLRLRPGLNQLKVKINGQLKITCPAYVLIGF